MNEDPLAFPSDGDHDLYSIQPNKDLIRYIEALSTNRAHLDKYKRRDTTWPSSMMTQGL